MLEAGQTREGDLVQPGDALLCVDLVPGLSMTELALQGLLLLLLLQLLFDLL